MKCVSPWTLGLLCLVTLSCQPPDRRAQPNIIFILIDDQRHDFLSFLGHPWIQTPQIDRLAEKSVFLDHAFVTTSLCSPSRASILTGQYTHAHGVQNNVDLLDPFMPIFPSILQAGGYSTAFIGKWHMGRQVDEPQPGFDYWASFKGQGSYFNPTLNVNGDRKEFEGYTTDILTDLAVAYMRGQQASNKPYMLYLSHKAVHGPFKPAPRHEDHYANQDVRLPDKREDAFGKPSWVLDKRTSVQGTDGRDFSEGGHGGFEGFFRHYGEAMLGVDDSVGRITEELARQGALDDTVIIYFSDNGYMMGEHGMLDKRVMYEESIRVPAFVHWPARFAASRQDAFILNIDLAPTIIEIAGLDIPESMQGQSILPLLTGEEIDWRDSFIYEYFADQNALQTPTIFGLRTQQYSYMTSYGVWDGFELYDLKQDPQQRYNLLGDIRFKGGNQRGPFVAQVFHQKPDLYPLVAELEEELGRKFAALGGSRKPKWGLD